MTAEHRADRSIDEALARGLIDEAQATKAREYVAAGPFRASRVIDRIVSIIEDATRSGKRVKQF